MRSTPHRIPRYIVFSAPCHLVPLPLKYLLQYPFLEHPQPILLPQCERPSSTLIGNDRQNYSSVYLNLYIFLVLARRQKDSAPNDKECRVKFMRRSCQCLLIMYHESTKRPSGSVYVRRRYCSQYQHSTYFCQTSDTEGT